MMNFSKKNSTLIYTFVTYVADVSSFLADFCNQLTNKKIKQ